VLICIPMFWRADLVSIDKTSHEVGPSEKLTFPPGRLEELQDELPDNAPRFVLLSYEVCLLSWHVDSISLNTATDGRVIPWS